MSKDIVKHETGETALSVPDYGAFSGVGRDDVGQSGISIPYVNLLQALSPQVAGGVDEVVDGAHPGLFYNTVSGILLPHVDFVIAHERETYVQWGPDDAGRGKKLAEHLPESQSVRDAIKNAKQFNDLKIGNDSLVQTFFALGLVINDPANPSPAIFSISSTKIKPYRKYRTLRMQFAGGGPPVFAHMVRISSVDDRNSAGKPFKNLQFSPASGSIANSLLAPDHVLFKLAAELRSAYLGGTAKVAEDSAKSEDVPF